MSLKIFRALLIAAKKVVKFFTFATEKCLEDSNNFSILGTVTEDKINHTYTGFSANNILVVPVKNFYKNLDMVLHFKTPSSTNSKAILHTVPSAYGMSVQIESNTLRFYVGNGSTSWVVSNFNTQISMANSTEYWLRITWDGVAYRFFTSSDSGVTWTEGPNICFNTTPIYWGTNKLYIGGNTNPNKWNFNNGIIYLNDFYIKTDTFEWHPYLHQLEVGDTININDGMATSSYDYSAYQQYDAKGEFTANGAITSIKEENGDTLYETDGPFIKYNAYTSNNNNIYTIKDPVPYKYKYVSKVGGIADFDGTIRNFGQSNYLSLGKDLKSTNATYIVKFHTGTSIGNDQQIISCEKLFNLSIGSSQLRMYRWQTSSNVGATSIEANKTYYARITINGTTKTLEYRKEEDTEYTQCWSGTDTGMDVNYNSEIRMGYHSTASSSSYVFNGYIYLKGCEFTIDSDTIPLSAKVLDCPVYNQQHKRISVSESPDYDDTLDTITIDDVVYTRDNTKDVRGEYPESSVNITTSTPYLAYTFEGGTQENSYFSKLEEPRLLNATIVGTLTNDNGVYSGFSDNDYLMLNNLFTNNTTSFELIFKVKQTARSSNEGLLDSGTPTGQNIRFTIDSNGYPHFRVNSSLSANEYKVDITGTKTVALNNWGYYKATYNSTTGYTVSTSTDGINWEGTVTSSELTAPLYQGGIIWYIGDNVTTGSYIQGSMDIKETSITVDGTTTTFNKFSDLYTYDGTTITIADPQPDYIIKKPEIINAINNGCTDLGNGVYQGGSNKYIYFNSSILANKDNWELVIKYTYNGGGSYACIIAPNNNTSNFILQTSGSSLYFAAAKTGAWNLFNSVSLNLSLTSGTTYFFKLTYDSTTGYTFSYKLNISDNWTQTWSSSITDKIQFNLPYMYFLNFGGFLTSQYANGPIDLSETYFIVEGVRTDFWESLSGLEIDNILYERTSSNDLRQDIPATINTNNNTDLHTMTLTTNVDGYRDDTYYAYTNESDESVYTLDNPIKKFEEEEQLPLLTANGTMGGVDYACTASHQSQPAWWAFDGDLTGSDRCWWTSHGRTSTTNPCWITYYTPEAIYPVKLVLYNEVTSPESPKTGVFQGSNDNSTWDNIADINVPNNNAGARTEILVTPSNSYKYFRLYFTESWGSGGVSIQEIQIYKGLGEPSVLYDSNLSPLDSQPDFTIHPEGIVIKDILYTKCPDNNIIHRVTVPSLIGTETTVTQANQYIDAKEYRIIKMERLPDYTYDRLSLGNEQYTPETLPQITKLHSYLAGNIINGANGTLLFNFCHEVLHDRLYVANTFTLTNVEVGSTVTYYINSFGGYVTRVKTTTDTDISIPVYSKWVINYVVSKEGYQDITGSYTVPVTITGRAFSAEVQAIPVYTFTINPTPADATVTLKAEGYTQVGNSIIAIAGTVVDWEVSKFGYYTQKGKYTITEE